MAGANAGPLWIVLWTPVVTVILFPMAVPTGSDRVLGAKNSLVSWLKDGVCSREIDAIGRGGVRLPRLLGDTETQEVVRNDGPGAGVCSRLRATGRCGGHFFLDAEGRQKSYPRVNDCG